MLGARAAMPDETNPRVTVLVPTIGRIDYLPATRASLEAQTFGDYELLVLDNASPEGARAFLEDWAAADPRVRILRCDPRIPMFPNFKRGLRAARGEFLTFCHDDDILLPRFLERSLEVMEQSPNMAFCGSNYVFIDEGGRVIAERDEIPRDEVWGARRYIRTLISRGRNPVTMQSVFYRRSAFGPDAEAFDDTITLHFGDFVNLMRIAEGHEVGLIAETLVQVRQHAAQASSAMSLADAIPLRTRIMADYIADYVRRWPGEELFARELARLNARAARRAFVWGWMAARSEGEARACANGVDGGLGIMLHGLERVGVRGGGRGKQLAKIVRRVAGSLGI